MTVHLPQPMTAASYHSASGCGPQPPALPRNGKRTHLLRLTALGIPVSPIWGAERSESRKGEKASYERISLLILFIQIKKKKAPTPVAVFLW